MISMEYEGHGRRFSWSIGKERDEPTRRRRSGTSTRDMSSPFVANEDMLRGLYHGNWRGLQFASPLAAPPIDIPSQMMGLPTPHSDDPRTQEVLDEIVSLMAADITKINQSSLLLGNAWRWPRYDATLMQPVWEWLPDPSITAILVDVGTGRPVAIMTSERIIMSVGEEKTATAERKRRFDPAMVTVKWSGEQVAAAQDFTARNVSGMLPINFPHGADEGEFRGYSVLAPVIRDLKDYHDADFRISETLTKFKVKQKQRVKSVTEWVKNNMGSSASADDLADYDVVGSDFILNQGPDEETEYEFLPGEATAALEKLLERRFWKIFEGTRLPEMFWGGIATGNHATAEGQIQQAVSYVESLRKDRNRPFFDLFTGTLAVLSAARLETYQPFTMGWNRLESVSADVKSLILLRFSQSVASLSATATLTKKQLHTLWDLNFPESNPGKYEDFIAGLGDMAKHKQLVGMDPFAAAELADAGMLGDLGSEEDQAK